jgi:hypothetical protein
VLVRMRVGHAHNLTLDAVVVHIAQQDHFDLHRLHNNLG